MPTIDRATGSEEVGQRAADVVHDRARPRRRAQDGRLAIESRDAVGHELGEERVEVGEMPVQHAFRARRLGRHRPAGEPGRPVPEQDALGGVEQAGPHFADGNPGRQRVPSSLTVDEWALAH